MFGRRKIYTDEEYITAEIDYATESVDIVSQKEFIIATPTPEPTAEPTPEPLPESEDEEAEPTTEPAEESEDEDAGTGGDITPHE